MANSRYAIHSVSSLSDTDTHFADRTVVYTAQGTIYVFWVDSDTTDVCYAKSSDGGRNWTDAVVLLSGSYQSNSGTNYAIWYDRWTPGDTGNLIHIWGIDASPDDVMYCNLTVTNDSISTPVAAFAGVSSTTATSLSGCKTRGGNLLVVYDIDNGTEIGMSRSVDGGVNWTTRASPVESGSQDYWLIFPGNEADNQDAWLVFWDRSATEISLKVYDDSADSFAETSISTGMSSTSLANCRPQFAGCIRPSDNHLLLVAWNSRDLSTADLKTWDINGSGSITAKTDVVTNSDDCQCASITVNEGGSIWVHYIGKSDGSQVVGTTAGIYHKVSYDGMTTWSSEKTTFDAYLENAKGLGTPMNVYGSQNPLVVWYQATAAAAQLASETDMIWCAPSSARRANYAGGF